MKYIKRINEAFSKRFTQYKDLLRSIWFVSEEDLFNDCEIGPVIDINKESYQLKEHFSV